MPENNEHKHVGEAIKARRLALGLTQPELCRRLGWKEQSISAISQIETGSSANLTIESLKTFAIALNCSVSDLVHSLTNDLALEKVEA